MAGGKANTTILVTGASGFIGSAVARRLLDAGYRVRVLLRPESPRRNLEDLAVEIVTGDVTDPASLEQAMAGCAAVFHAAADYRLWTRRPRELYRTNVTGTVNVMRAALQAGVDRVVYTSSVATLGHHRDRTPADEETPATMEDMIGHYKRSKFLAEERVRELIEQERLPAVLVHPTAPVGPRDIKPTPTGRMVLDAACGRMPAYVDTGLNLVHVDDVAHGHLLALEHGEVGERYILGGENLPLKEILAQVARLTGRPPPRFRMPHGVALSFAYLCEAWARVGRGEPAACIDAVRMARRHMFFSSQKAERTLGYRARPATEALRDAVEWFQSHGYCRQ